MIIIPAIDIKDGKVVRLYKGRFDQQTVYAEDPVVVAKNWRKDGAKWLHIVDLDGARDGVSKNLKIVRKIATRLLIPVQFGGGVRTMEAIAEAIACGVKRVIIGTKAVEDKQFVKEAVAKYGHKIAVSIDSLGEIVMTKGWTESDAKTLASEMTREMEHIGVKTLIFTDISRDGTMQGPRIATLKNILSSTKMEIIFSGGISDLNDIRRINEIGRPNLFGVIVGKALYEGKFALSDAVEICSQKG